MDRKVAMLMGSSKPSSAPTFAIVTGLAFGVIVTACAPERLDSLPQHDPPPIDPYDPSDGIGDEGGGYYDDGGADGGDGGGDGGGECADDNRRCAHAFSFPDGGEDSVELYGDFASDGWDNGVALQSDGNRWRVTVPVPWATEVQYKFLVDGSVWVTDPDNPETVDDGSGGQNSVLAPVTCDDYTCEPETFGTFDWRDSVIYFVFVDRFFNGDPSNDAPIGVELATEWQGGDWAGITAKIEEGYFNELGINTLWLSVPADNADVSGLGVDGYDYSAYHGYWPTDLSRTEARFGTMAELQQLVDTAHDHDLKVLVDYAMNHVHADAPVYADHPEWFWPNDNGAGGNCVCGEGCGWDGEAGRRCWFTPYLPDFNFTNAAAREFSVTNALWWIEQSGIDGFRLDAVKHIEDSWLLDLRERVTAEIEPATGEHFYMVGETFTGNRETIAHYVGPEMLDGQFDFPLRMQIVQSVLMRQGSMQDLAGFLDSNEDYYGAAIMSTFIGNHDIPRVIHLAEDAPMWDNVWTDGKDRAWSNRPPLTSGTRAYERMALGFTIIMTMKGAPLVYYGDEIGLPGAGDPDNRRFMQWDGYSAGQILLRDHLERLLTIRSEHPALRRGTRRTIAAAGDTLVYEQTFANDRVIVAINRSDSVRSVGGLPGGTLTDLVTQTEVEGPSVEVPARTGYVLVP